MTDAFKAAAKYATQEKNLEKWRRAYVDTINAKHAEKLRLLRAALTPEAAAIVVAAEHVRANQTSGKAIIEQFTREAPDAFADITEPLDPEPSLSPRLMQPVDPVPAGGIVEVAEKQKGARR